MNRRELLKLPAAFLISLAGTTESMEEPAEATVTLKKDDFLQLMAQINQIENTNFLRYLTVMAMINRTRVEDLHLQPFGFDGKKLLLPQPRVSDQEG